MLYEWEVQDLLNSLGIGQRFIGYSLATEVTLMVLADDAALRSFQHTVLIPLARRTGGTTTAVYQDLRTVACHAWQTNRTQLCRIAGYQLQKAPGVVEFIDILATCILRRHRRDGQEEP